MKYDKTVGCVDIHIDTKRIDNNIHNAQKALNMQGYIKEIAGLVPAVDEAGNGVQQQTETKKPNLDIEYSDEPAEQPFAEGEEEPAEFEEV